MGASRANHQWLTRGVLSLALLSLSLVPSCKHRRGPSVPEEWDPEGFDASTADLRTLLRQTKSLRVVELFEDGFVTTDTLTWRLDLIAATLDVERRFDPVPFTSEEPMALGSQAGFAASQAAFLQHLSEAKVRQVPRCNPYGAVDGGYGGRFLILIDRAGREHRFGASDSECAAHDHECSGPCLSQDSMTQAVAALSAVLPVPEKPRTVFTCAAGSPLPCAQPEFTVHGSWDKTELRADIRRALAQRLCGLAAFTLDPSADGSWVVKDSGREVIGTVRFSPEDRSVSCLTRSP